MARYESWLALQRTSVEGNTMASTIVLEAPDGARAATWGISQQDLQASIDGILTELREALPKGKHQFRLAALDTAGSQLSFLPIVITGAGEAATEASQGRINDQRANSIFISNSERTIAMLMASLERSGELIEASTEANLLQSQEINKLIAATRDERREETRQAARDARLAEISKTFSPMLGLGVDFLVALGQAWITQKTGAPAESSSGEKTVTSETPPTSGTPPAPPELLPRVSLSPPPRDPAPPTLAAVAAPTMAISTFPAPEPMVAIVQHPIPFDSVADSTDGRPPTSDESTGPRVAGSDSRTTEPCANVQGRVEADSRSRPTRNGPEHKSAKHSERLRAGRSRSEKSERKQVT